MLTQSHAGGNGIAIWSKSVSDDETDFEVVAKIKKVSTAFKTVGKSLSFLYHFFSHDFDLKNKLSFR